MEAFVVVASRPCYYIDYRRLKIEVVAVFDSSVVFEFIKSRKGENQNVISVRLRVKNDPYSIISLPDMDILTSTVSVTQLEIYRFTTIHVRCSRMASSF